MAFLAPGSHLGRYEIKEQLGRGGMAVVFRAYDPLLHRDVAIKVLSNIYTDDPTFLHRFAQEARTIARLRHPNILQIFDFGEDSGFTYIVSELLTGGTLQDRAEGPMLSEEAVRVLRPVAEALDYAHSQGIVHRDIKPSNVLLTADGTPVLADFGLSKVMEQTYRMTSPREALGTPEYMSPEQVLGQNTDYRSDLYSFGILIYELIVGKTPFHADTPTGTLMAHVHQPLPLPDAALTPAIKTALLKATAKNPTDRFPRAAAMVDALVAAAGRRDSSVTLPISRATLVLPQLEDDSSQLPSGPPEGPRPKRRLRRRIVMGFALVTVVAAMIGGAMLARDYGIGAGGPPSSPTSGIPAPLPTAPPEPSTPTPQPPTPPPAFPLAEAFRAVASVEGSVLPRIQDNVASLRQLKPKQPIVIFFETREELARKADEVYFRRLRLLEPLRESQELFAALGLLDEGDNLEEITRELLLQQVYALFDDLSGNIYVFSDAPAIGHDEELAYASAYMAGLQQQHFDVAKLRDLALDNLDQFRAVTAFTSGEVFMMQEGYRNSYLKQQAPSAVEGPRPSVGLEELPNVIAETAWFPRIEGDNFVRTVFWEQGGWEAVNAVYANPPASSEQVIHPEKYFSNEQPQNPELPSLAQLEAALGGRGWQETSRNTAGELLLRAYMEQRLDSSVASSAAAGWGGDRYVLLFGPAGEQVFLLHANWDTPEDSLEFFNAFQQSADRQAEGKNVQRVSEGARQWWVSHDQATLIERRDQDTIVVIADNQGLAQRALDALP